MTKLHKWAMAEIKGLSRRRQKRVKRLLRKKIDRHKRVKRMKHVVAALIRKYNDNACKMVSSAIKKAKHRERRRRRPQGLNK